MNKLKYFFLALCFYSLTIAVDEQKHRNLIPPAPYDMPRPYDPVYTQRDAAFLSVAPRPSSGCPDHSRHDKHDKHDKDCPSCKKACFIAGFFVASEILNVPKVGNQFNVTLLGTEVEDNVTLGIYAITYKRPFLCPVSVVAFSSGISFTGDLDDCEDILIDRAVEVRSSTRSHAVLRAPLGVKIAFKSIPVT